MSVSDECDINLRKIFFDQLAEENNLSRETTLENMLQEYLKDRAHLEVLRRQISKKACINRILVVGHTGVGKSSIVNLLMKKEEAAVNNNAVGCTFEFKAYQAVFGDGFYEIIDTVGLNESKQGTVPLNRALKELTRFIRKNKRGFSCILFVMRQGRIDNMFEQNYKLFYGALMKMAVPAVLFINHCEDDEPMNRWITDQNNSNLFQSYGFRTIVCGTAKKVNERSANYLPALRDETYKRLWQEIQTRSLEKPITIESDLNLFKTVWNTLCGYIRIQRKFISERFTEFIDELHKMGIDEDTIQEITRILS